MLKDKLEKLASTEKEKPLCALGETMAKMDPEDREAFIVAMKSAVSSPEIFKILRQEGINDFGISHLREKRKMCFKSDAQCVCLKKAQS